jgi:hypothetical protein
MCKRALHLTIKEGTREKHDPLNAAKPQPTLF